MNKGARNQIKLMKKCGFAISDTYGGVRIWARGELRIGLFENKCPPLARVVLHVIHQTISRTKKHTQIRHEDFPVENPTFPKHRK